MEDRRDLDPAPPARGPAEAAAAPPEAELGGPGPARGAARRDTQRPPPRAAACSHPGHDRALAPRHRPPPLGGAVQARQDRPADHPPEHQGPGPPAGPGEPRMGLPQDPRRAGRPGSQGRSVDRMGDPQDQLASTPRRGGPDLPGRSSCTPRPRRSWPATSSPSTCSTAPRPTSWPSSSTPPGASASSASPSIPPGRGPPSRPVTFVRHEAHCCIARVAGRDWRRCLWI